MPGTLELPLGAFAIVLNAVRPSSFQCFKVFAEEVGGVFFAAFQVQLPSGDILSASASDFAHSEARGKYHASFRVPRDVPSDHEHQATAEHSLFEERFSF